jgi:Cdc6-like AAA superfamily ATPase
MTFGEEKMNATKPDIGVNILGLSKNEYIALELTKAYCSTRVYSCMHTNEILDVYEKICKELEVEKCAKAESE